MGKEGGVEIKVSQPEKMQEVVKGLKNHPL